MATDMLHLTEREVARLQIAAQVEKFLSNGGNIEMVSGPGFCEQNPVGRVWWEAGGNLRGSGPIVGHSF